MISFKFTFFPIFLGIFLATFIISITNGHSNLHHHSKQIHRRLLAIDQILTGLSPITDDLPIVNKGLPPLSSLLVNSTVTQVCEELDSVKSEKSELLYFAALGYLASVQHYMASSAALPSCVFRPATNDDVVHALRLIEQKRISFSINSGKHTGNPFFSSTLGGIQIDMRKFSQIEPSKEYSFVDVGPGNVWENVYDKLEGTNIIVLGGRVSGVGVGGFLLGGGGYSYLTQKYGMASDSIISIDIIVPNPARLITISKHSHPDLFFAVKGGGNQFGIITNFRLKTFPISPTVWGGTRLYLGHNEEFQEAALSFANDEIQDKNAAAIFEFLYFGKLPIFAVQAFYDGPQPPSGIFDRFPSGGLLEPLIDTWGPTNSLSQIVRSAPSNLTNDLRGYFNSLSVQKFTPGIMKVALEEITRLNQELVSTGLYFHVAFEWAGKEYGSYANENNSPFPYYKSPQPIELYFAWVEPLEDEYYHTQINIMAERILDQARLEGQHVDDLPNYPNYAIDNTPAKKLFGSKNAARMKQIKEKYDPHNTMRLTNWYEGF